MSRSVERALSILNLFNGNKADWGITEISQELDLPKSTIHSLVKTLELCGYLQSTETSKYRLGIKAYELGRAYSGNVKLGVSAEPMIRFLNQKYDQSVHVAIYAGRRAVFVIDSRAETGHSIFPRVGADIAAYCTAVGKVLLAWQSAEHIANYLQTEKLLPFTKNTIADAETLRLELDTICQQGYAIDREEVLLGTGCIAAPVFGYSGQIVAAISLSGPVDIILKPDSFKMHCYDVVQAATNISIVMGYNQTT